MSGIQLTDKQREEIFRRGNEADAFIHSPLFVALTEWVEQEERLMSVAIALDRREDTQKNLTRQEFVEQMSGYYRGIHVYHGLFKEFINKARELQKIVEAEATQKEQESKEKLKMEQLRKQAFPDGSK